MKHIVTILVLLPLLTAAQKTSTNFYSAIPRYDLHTLWRADSILLQEIGKKDPFPEPIGYIGNDFQRFYIHYLTVRKSATDPRVYEVTGKTRVRDNICPFSGTITIVEAWLGNSSHKEGYKQGGIKATIRFYEDSTHPGSGAIKGTLTTDFCIDAKDHLQYDAIMLVADSYDNNQARTLWKNYRTGAEKICNWGDYRMPDSRELDHGAGDVSIDEKYIQNGWVTYYKAYAAKGEEREKAQALEAQEWWKD